MKNKHEQLEEERPKLKVQLHRFCSRTTIFKHRIVVESFLFTCYQTSRLMKEHPQ